MTETEQAERKAEEQATATEILRQLGGRRFVAMTGARNFINDHGALTFRLPGGGFTRNGINYVRIELTPADLYKMTFNRCRWQPRGGHWQAPVVVAEADGIYNDQLQAVFEETTGLATSLNMGRATA